MGGIILDRYSFKGYFSIIMFMSTVLSFTFQYVAQNRTLFIIYLSLTYFVTGAIFVSLPIFYAKIFGPDVGS
jgi:predicted MFS family arabinose efflux permease